MDDFKIGDFREYGNRKTAIADKLNISKVTMYELHKIASELIPDYIKSFPTVDGNPYLKSPLTLYQCYVLWALNFWKHERALPWIVIKDKLKNDYDFSSKFDIEYFNQLYPPVEYEHTGILQTTQNPQAPNQ